MVAGCVVAGTAFADDISNDEASATAAHANAALRQAELALAAARRAGNVWLATPRRLAEARAAAERGEFAHAVAGAEHAQREATLALNQIQLERARYRLDRDPELDPAVRAAVRELLARYDGAGALRALEQADPKP